MPRYISPAEIRDQCGYCKKVEVMAAKSSGKDYHFCKKYMTPCFKVLDQCKREEADGEDRALELMEEGISKAENSFEPDAYGPRGGWF